MVLYDFHEHLNRQNAHLQFSKESKENGKTDFLESLFTREKKRLLTTYIDPTQNDRLLDQSSFKPSCHKATYATGQKAYKTRLTA